MNIYNEAITGITTPEKSTVDYIHCIVHTILFHRTILSIETPQEVKMKTLDFHYVPFLFFYPLFKAYLYYLGYFVQSPL